MSQSWIEYSRVYATCSVICQLTVSHFIESVQVLHHREAATDRSQRLSLRRSGSLRVRAVREVDIFMRPWTRLDPTFSGDAAVVERPTH